VSIGSPPNIGKNPPTSSKMIESTRSFMRCVSSSSMTDEVQNQKEESIEDVEVLKATIHSLKAIKQTTEDEYKLKLQKSMKDLFILESRSATLEEELRGRDNLLIQKSKALEKEKERVKKYKGKWKSSTSVNLSIVPRVANFTLITDSENDKLPRTRSSSNAFESFLSRGSSDEFKMEVKNQDDEFEQKNSNDVNSDIKNLRKRYNRRGLLIVNLKKQLKASKNKTALQVKYDQSHLNTSFLDIVNEIAEKHQKLFEFTEKQDCHVKGMLQKLQKRSMELKYYVAETSSERYFHQFTIKSRAMKQCITDIYKFMCEHPVVFSVFQSNLHESTTKALQLCKQQNFRRNSPESNPYWDTKPVQNTLRKPIYSSHRKNLAHVQVIPRGCDFENTNTPDEDSLDEAFSGSNSHSSSRLRKFRKPEMKAPKSLKFYSTFYEKPKRLRSKEPKQVTRKTYTKTTPQQQQARGKRKRACSSTVFDSWICDKNERVVDFSRKIGRKQSAGHPVRIIKTIDNDEKFTEGTDVYDPQRASSSLSPKRRHKVPSAESRSRSKAERVAKTRRGLNRSQIGKII